MVALFLLLPVGLLLVPASAYDPSAFNLASAIQVAEALVPYWVCWAPVAPEVVTAVPLRLVPDEPLKLLE